MKSLFDKLSTRCSKITTQTYSTSFSLGIRLLDKKFHAPIYGIYGFVRFADEIVDSFHDYSKEALLKDFRQQTFNAIASGISLNPILNSFQAVVNTYKIDRHLIEKFLDSMEMDLYHADYSRTLYDQYILGSAEVVGLMCLRVFTEENKNLYEELKHPAMKLGAAFQKINFLRDIKKDSRELGRIYFPGIDIHNFSEQDKQAIATEIEQDFAVAIEGLKKLPSGSRKGVALAYTYYRVLFNKIRGLPPQKIMTERVRIANGHKLGIMLQAVLAPGIRLR